MSTELTTEEMAKKAKREYMRKWRVEHKSQVKAAQQRYWAKIYKQKLNNNS